MTTLRDIVDDIEATAVQRWRDCDASMQDEYGQDGCGEPLRHLLDVLNEEAQGLDWKPAEVEARLSPR